MVNNQLENPFGWSAAAPLTQLWTDSLSNLHVYRVLVPLLGEIIHTAATQAAATRDRKCSHEID